MIIDDQTNFVYVADTLPLRYSNFCEEFLKLLNSNNIDFAFLKQTKDVWAVDYMPIQIGKDDFVQFVYEPDYLMNSIKWQKTISDVNSICNDINIRIRKSNLIVDGGNVIKWHNKVIMCDKVFAENKSTNPKKLIKELENIFQVDSIIFIPTHPDDIIGHADGMVRFLDGETVIVNDFSKENRLDYVRFLSALNNAKLNIIEIPYNPYTNNKLIDANGIYINYLQLKGNIILPLFGLKEDEKVVELFEKLFPKTKISGINSCDIAVNGGILNCITWNILK